jgi:hypothetical protein
MGHNESITVRVRQTPRIFGMRSSSCESDVEFDYSIAMLSSSDSCVFDMHISLRPDWLANLWLPNEDFGMLNETLGHYFRSTFQRFVAQIRYSHP